MMSRISSPSSYGSPDLETGRAGHAVTKRAHLAAADLHHVHVEELDVGNRAAVQLLDQLGGVGPLNLEAVVAADDGLASGAPRRAVVLRRRDVESAGLGVELNPVRRRRAPDEQQAVLGQVEQNAVADDVAVIRARNELLGAIDGEALEAVGRQIREQLQGIRALDVLLDHVVRLVEQDAGVSPRALLVAPVRVLGRDDRIHVGADLRIAEHGSPGSRRFSADLPDSSWCLSGPRCTRFVGGAKDLAYTRWRLDVNDDVHQLRKPGHEPVLDHVRGGMRRLERHVAVEPEVQIQEGIVRRAAGPDFLAADDARQPTARRRGPRASAMTISSPRTRDASCAMLQHA